MNSGKMKELVINGHQGLGDQIECHGIVRHYAEHFDKVNVLCTLPHNLEALRFMYRDNPSIKVVTEKEFPVNHEGRLVHPINVFSLELYGLAYDGNNAGKKFYKGANVPFEFRKEKFYLERDKEAEKETLAKLNPTGEDFIFVHDDPARGYNINIDTDLKIIRNTPEVPFFSMLGVIEKAKEIHCMSSSYFCLLDCMPDDEFDAPKFYHHNIRGVNLDGGGMQGKWTYV